MSGRDQVDHRPSESYTETVLGKGDDLLVGVMFTHVAISLIRGIRMPVHSGSSSHIFVSPRNVPR